MVWLLSLFLFTFSASTSIDSTLDITINNIRSQNGNIQVTVFVDQATFKSETPYKYEIFSKAEHVDQGVFKCSISLPEGEYGIAILDDENADGDMNYNFLGVPKEGYGFSNFIHTGFQRPTFSDFVFTMSAGTKDMNIKLRYF